jgi:sporulation protein YlmC with PRC-barrel domain
MDTHEIDDWQALVNKPVYANDGREVGVVRSIQSENLMVSVVCGMLSEGGEAPEEAE